MMKWLSILVFALIVGGLLFIIIGITKKFSGGGTYTLKAFFANSGGIEKGAPVLLSGIDVGKVTHMELEQKKRGITLTLEINESVSIPNDSPLKVAEKGMLGEMRLMFSYGKSKDHYKPGDEIPGTVPVGISDFMSQASSTLDSAGKEIEGLAKSLNLLIGDESFQGKIKGSMGKVPDMIDEIKKAVSQNNGKMSRALISVDKLMKSAESSTKHINKILVDLEKEKFSEKLSGAVGEGGGLMKSLNTASQELKPLIKKLDGLSVQMTELLSSTHLAMSTLEGVLQGLEEGKGSVGMLLKDDSLYLNLNKTLVQAHTLLKFLEENPSSIIFGRKKKKSSWFGGRKETRRAGVGKKKGFSSLKLSVETKSD